MLEAPKTPLLAVDCVVIGLNTHILYIRRKNPPYEGMLALPGGFVDQYESTEAACCREVEEETGLAINNLRLVGVYSKPGRDPRGPVCSIAYMTSVNTFQVKAGDDAEDAVWLKLHDDPCLAFDHNQIVKRARLLLEF